MPHDHHHHHHHFDANDSQKNILVALTLNFSFAIIEFVGGLWTGSVAIISDSIHDFGDSLALFFAYYFEKMAQKKPNDKYRYGYRRLSLLSALLTGAFLLAGSVWVLSETIPRLFDPVQPNAEGMVGFALLGMGVNGYAAWKLSHGNTQNEKVVSWHLIEDVLSWVGVFIGSLIMIFFDVPIIDPLLSLVFTCVILFGVFKSVRSTLELFLQAVPPGVDLDEIKGRLNAIAEVIAIHDVRIWSLDGESHVITLHAVVRPELSIDQLETIKAAIRAQLPKKMHATIEMEREGVHCPTC